MTWASRKTAHNNIPLMDYHRRKTYSGFAPVFCFMAKYSFDILGLIGLLLLAVGIYLAFGPAWALMVAGLLLLLLAMLGARGRQ